MCGQIITTLPKAPPFKGTGPILDVNRKVKNICKKLVFEICVAVTCATPEHVTRHKLVFTRPLHVYCWHVLVQSLSALAQFWLTCFFVAVLPITAHTFMAFYHPPALLVHLCTGGFSLLGYLWVLFCAVLRHPTQPSRTSRRAAAAPSLSGRSAG